MYICSVFSWCKYYPNLKLKGKYFNQVSNALKDTIIMKYKKGLRLKLCNSLESMSIIMNYYFKKCFIIYVQVYIICNKLQRGNK